MLVDNIGDSLGIGCRARTATVDSVVDMGEFVGDSVRLRKRGHQRFVDSEESYAKLRM